jgi:hypothetical protein
MYTLPNKKRINEDDLFDAYLSYKSRALFFLDAGTGEIRKVAPEDANGLRGDPERYYGIPTTDEAIIISWMDLMAREFVAFENPELAEKLLDILAGENPIENFHRAIEGDWSYGWPQWEQDMAFEEIEKWLDSLPFEVDDDWQEFFESNCDCAICQAMAKGSDDEKSIKVAFQEEKFKEVMRGIMDGSHI